MKAIRVHEFGGPEVLKWEEVPDPAPGPGQVVVRIRAAGVNPVDTYIRSGAYAVKPQLPYTPGADAAGFIEAVGSGVAGLTRGERVYTLRTLSGAYAELTLCDAGHVRPLPGNIGFTQGAGISVPYGTAYRGLFQRARAVAGETVLVHGASGGVGLAGVQLARAHGLIVIGTAGTERGRALAREQGAHHVVDHNSPGYLDEIRAISGGRGVDVILEMLSNVNLGKDLTLLSRGGRVVVIGCRGSVEINPRDAMSRDACILGMVLFNATPQEMDGIHAGIGAGLANGSLRPVVGKEFPLQEAAAAHQAVMAPGASGKIVLVP
ncbi:MAG: NADPH:quinone reductase [Candidatus Methylomirabilota bacterium]